MVAKTYQSYEQITEPYEINGKKYVKLKTPNGAIKQCRWYTEYEYNKMYGIETSSSFDPHRKVLGFKEKGFITIFKGDDISLYDEWFHSIKARYTRFWGWYLTSDETVPETMPAGIEAIKLPWEFVGGEDGELYNEEKVAAGVTQALYPEEKGNYLGAIGDKITASIVVEKVIPLENDYGVSNMFIMRASSGEELIWVTQVKNWEVGYSCTISGTVKNTKIYKGVKQTILTRCKEI